MSRINRKSICIKGRQVVAKRWDGTEEILCVSVKDAVLIWLEPVSIKTKQDRTLSVYDTKGRKFMDLEVMMYCAREKYQSCGNCSQSCKQEGRYYDIGCKNWMPDRAGHPNTPNPCEAGYFDPALSWGACTNCQYAKKN